MIKVIEIEHPLTASLLGAMRDKDTEPPRFRQALTMLSRFLIYEAMRDIPATQTKVDTPLETTERSVFPNNEIAFIPILRAGLAMEVSALEMFPDASVYHIGMKRDETTLKPVFYYSSLDKSLRNCYVFILDPMLATGGTAAAALDMVASYNPKKITFISVIAAPVGIKVLENKANKLGLSIQVIVSSVDRELNEHGYILPGLGDAGDRFFGTQ